jgi:hypothetical protein
MKADRNAPVYASAGAKIATAPTSAWDLLTRFADWHEWNTEVRALRVSGPLASGTEFRWRQGTATIAATLQTVEAPRFVSWSARLFATWTGGAIAIDAIHQYELSPVEGGTLVVTTESWDGLLARVMRKSLQRKLQKSCNDVIAALKAEAEQPSGEDRNRTPGGKGWRFG